MAAIVLDRCEDIADRGLRIADRGSRIEDRGSRIEDRGSRIEDRGSRIEDRGASSIFYPRSSIFDLLLSGGKNFHSSHLSISFALRPDSLEIDQGRMNNPAVLRVHRIEHEWSFGHFHFLSRFASRVL